MATEPTSSLYVRELPTTINDQMLQAAFSQHPGFKAARLRTRRKGTTFAFIDFVDVASATTAFTRFQGYKFSAQDPTGIVLEYSKPQRPDARAPPGGGDRGRAGMPGGPSSAYSAPGSFGVPSGPPRGSAGGGYDSYSRDPVRSGGGPPPISHGGYGAPPPPPPPGGGRGGPYGGGGYGAPPGAPAAAVGGYGYQGAPTHSSTPAGPPAAGRYGAGGPPPLPRDATPTLYVEGVPDDTSERELAHLFRPFDGFQGVRLVPHTGRSGRKMYLCFAEFRSSSEAYAARGVIDGYEMEPRARDGGRLRISFSRKAPKARNDGRSLRDITGDLDLDRRRRSRIDDVLGAAGAGGGDAGGRRRDDDGDRRGGGRDRHQPTGADRPRSGPGRRNEDMPAWAKQGGTATAGGPRDTAKPRDEDRAVADTGKADESTSAEADAVAVVAVVADSSGSAGADQDDGDDDAHVEIQAGTSSGVERPE